MPKMGEEGLNCACRPSLFAYPSPVTAEVKETVRQQAGPRDMTCLTVIVHIFDSPGLKGSNSKHISVCEVS